jgi:tetratricopeptide (TPR) repeat protein
MPNTSHFTVSKLAEARAHLKQPQRATQICHEILAQHQPDPPDREFCEAQYLLGVSHRLSGHLTEAEGELLYAHQLAEALKLNELRALSAVELAQVCIELTEFPRAIALLTGAVELLAKQEHALERAKAIFALANAYMCNGEQDLALRHLEEALVGFTKANSENGVVAVQCALVQVELGRGHFAEAEQRVSLCLKMLPLDSHVKNRFFLRLTLAECYKQQQKLDRAIEVLEATTQDANTEGYHFLESRGLLMMQEIHRSQGEVAVADELRDHAFELARLHGFLPALEAHDRRDRSN